MSDDKHKYINSNYKKVSAKMYDYKCDVKLKVEKETFKAHRHVLADASDYFDAMFSHDMREKEQDVIELLEISPCGFTSMMEYFYHGHVTVSTENIEDIIEAARFFHIEWLIHVCCDFLVRHLSLENYHTVIHLADKYYLGDLRAAIFNFVSNRFVMLSENPKFMLLSYEVMYQLLLENYYIDATEAFILQTILKWLEHDPEGRAEHKTPLLQLIRYPLLEEEELEHIPDDLMDIPELKELIEDAKEYHSNPGRQCLMISDGTEVRGSQDVVVLFSAIEDAYQIQYKVPGTNGFFSEKVDTSFLQSVFEFSAVAVLGNFLFVAGGYDRRSWCSSPAFYRYNPRNRSWAQLTSMNCPRVSFTLCAAEKGLYAITGIEHIVQEGRDQEVILDSIEYYSPDLNLWELLPRLPLGCFSAGAVTLGSRVYVSGGISDDPEDTVPTSYLHVYNTGEQAWQRKANMLTERQAHSMVAMNDKIYVVGGYTTAADLMSFDNCLENEVYDTETNQWSLLQNTPPGYGHILCSSTILGNKIYLIGGGKSNSILYTFDTEKEKLEEGELCGENVQRVATLKAAFPPDLM